ncbi:unnamed protein product, partial [Tetraodon nigroviridis]
MEKLLLFLVVIAPCWTADLSGKVVIFSRESNSDHVKLKTSKTALSSVSTCLRFKTDLTRAYSLLSVATASHFNDFLLFKPETSAVRVHARDDMADFQSLVLAPNTWHSMCSTWNAENGLAQLWLNGSPTIKRFIKTGQITGALSAILGQDQDTFGGGFDAKQSFVGMLHNFHMWDHVLPASEIRQYMNGMYFTPGNVFSWKDLQYELSGS